MRTRKIWLFLGAALWILLIIQSKNLLVCAGEGRDAAQEISISSFYESGEGKMEEDENGAEEEGISAGQIFTGLSVFAAGCLLLLLCRKPGWEQNRDDMPDL